MAAWEVNWVSPCFLFSIKIKSLCCGSIIYPRTAWVVVVEKKPCCITIIKEMAERKAILCHFRMEPTYCREWWRTKKDFERKLKVWLVYASYDQRKIAWSYFSFQDCLSCFCPWLEMDHHLIKEFVADIFILIGYNTCSNLYTCDIWININGREACRSLICIYPATGFLLEKAFSFLTVAFVEMASAACLQSLLGWREIEGGRVSRQQAQVLAQGLVCAIKKGLY